MEIEEEKVHVYMLCGMVVVVRTTMLTMYFFSQESLVAVEALGMPIFVRTIAKLSPLVKSVDDKVHHLILLHI